MCLSAGLGKILHPLGALGLDPATIAARSSGLTKGSAGNVALIDPVGALLSGPPPPPEQGRVKAQQELLKRAPTPPKKKALEARDTTKKTTLGN